jgi:hypothetical protein
MSKRATYEVVGHRQIKVDELSPHPDAEMPIDADDRASLSDSIVERGIIDHDLIVLADTLQVVDGCNRLLAARAAGIDKVWCKLIRTNDVRAIVLDSLAVGRQRTTGQRIMAFIEMHQDDVLKAYETQMQTRRENLKHQCFSKVSRETFDEIPKSPFGIDAIAERLHVGREDVIRGIELTLALRNSENPRLQESAIAIMEMVYSGNLAIRRSRTALTGKKTVQHGRAQTDWYVVCQAAMTKLGNLSRHWDELSIEEQREFEDRWADYVVPFLPDSLRKMLART